MLKDQMDLKLVKKKYHNIK